MTGGVVLPALNEWKIAFLLLDFFFLFPLAYYRSWCIVIYEMHEQNVFERMFLYLKLDITFFLLFLLWLFWLIKIEKYFYVTFELFYLNIIVDMDVFFSPVPRIEHSIAWKNARYYICIKEYEMKETEKENEVARVDNLRGRKKGYEGNGHDYFYP